MSRSAAGCHARYACRARDAATEHSPQWVPAAPSVSARPLRESRRLPAPQVLAEALGLGVERGRAGDALAEVADEHDVERPQVGQLVDADVEVGGLGDQAADDVGRQVRDAARRSRRRRGPRCPTLALPPLSPERAPKCSPRACRARSSAGATSIVGGTIGSADGGPVGAGSMRMRVPSASDDDLVDLRRRHERRPVHAERRGRPGRRRREVAGVAGEGQLDGGRRERPPDGPLVGRLD